jgi:hypothetical protein
MRTFSRDDRYSNSGPGVRTNMGEIDTMSKQHVIKAVKDVEVNTHAMQTSAVGGHEWSALPPWEEPRCT